MPKHSPVASHLCTQANLEPGNAGISFQVKDLKRTCRGLKEKGVAFDRTDPEAD